MPKKRKRQAPHTAPKPNLLSMEELGRKASGDLAAGRFRDAIAAFKQLLKTEDRAEWRSGLAGAYVGRARELTAKGMLKEALAIWENRAALEGGISAHPEQLALLLRMGQLEPLLSLVRNPAAIPPGELDRLRPMLAAQWLAGADAIADQLPADDPVVRHGEAARSALLAYCAGDDAALQVALRAIPFRSPYRDWVQILKALQRLPEHPDEAAGLLARVPQDSAFGRIRRAAELALLDDQDLLAALQGVGKATARFACALRGWPPDRVALWEELSRLGQVPRPEALLRLMHRHRATLGEEWARRQGLRLLVADLPASLKWLGALGARPATKREAALVAAWKAETRGDDLWDTWEYWDAYARHLTQEGAPEGQTPKQRLRIALVLRRADRVGDVLGSMTPSDFPDDLDRVIAEQVEASLAWDPDDRDTYLRLIGYYRRGRQLKDVRRLLDRASAAWPKDLEVLAAALDAALDAGSFKKASAIARDMLTLDPINTGVRDRLVGAHLAHARKQIVRQRADLARKETEQAREWARGSQARDQVDLHAALITLLDAGAVDASELASLIGRLGGGLSALLAFALVGDAVKVPPRTLMKRLGLSVPASPGKEDLLAALGRLRAHADSGGKISRDLGTYVAQTLKSAPWTSLSRSETEAACDILRRCGLHPVRLRAAQVALKRWRGEPVFELHAFEAKYPNGYDGRSLNSIFRLEMALDRASQAGDTRTVLRIKDILAEYSPFGFGPPPFAPPPSLGGGAPADRTAGAILPVLIDAMGLDRALDMLELPAPLKREMKELERRVGKQMVVEALMTAMDALGDLDAPDIPLPGPRASGERKSPRDASRKEGSDPDDPSPDQLDLFS
jgi:tetratricopeptide (TPR) repeat protein